MRRVAALLAAALVLAGCSRSPSPDAGSPPPEPARDAGAAQTTVPGPAPSLSTGEPVSQPLGPGSPLTGAVSGLTGDVSALQGLVDALGGEIRDQEIVIPLATDMVFDFDKAEIKPEAQANLQRLAELLRKTSGAVRVNGHSDGKGDDAYNLALSKRRADAVADWLTANGAIPGARLGSAGYGEAQPIAANARPDGSDDPEGRARNRRVEIVIAR